MTQYISKSALVTEIERRKNLCEKISLDLRNQENKDYYQGKAEAYKEILDTLNALETKEVDLEKEVKKWKNEHGVYGMDDLDFIFAKHFFELGMTVSNKAKKGE